MLVRLFVVDEQFALFAVASRLVAGDCDDGEVGVAFAEDAVHFFQGAVGGFGVEDVDDGEDEGVAVGGLVSLSGSGLGEIEWVGVVDRVCFLHDGEDDVGLVFDGCKSHRCDHYDHEVERLDHS